MFEKKEIEFMLELLNNSSVRGIEANKIYCSITEKLEQMLTPEK